MTDLEISKALALAIGWEESKMQELPAKMLLIYPFGIGRGYSAFFDYRDWNVIGPIAERYNVFPYMHKVDGVPDGKWVVWPDITADAPQKAIALAVIGAAKP